MGIALEICNKVMSEVQGIKDTGFPLDAFPERVQTIILDMVRYENFKVEYLAPAMLSAVSSALGGTYYVRVKGQWITNAALYIIMVGRPGLGKTPPLEAAFCPIRWNDNAKIEKFKADMAAYQNAAKESKSDCGMEKPVLSRTLVSDFTPEALLYAHHNSPRGVTILVDEIMGCSIPANPLQQRTADRAAADGMERRRTGCGTCEQSHTAPYRTPLHQYDRNHTDEAYGRADEEGI